MYLWREFSSRDVGLAARGYCRGPQQGDLPPLDLPRCGPCITIEFARQQHEQHHSARKQNEDDMCLRTVGFSSFGSTHRILRACKLSGHTMWGICILTHTHTHSHMFMRACMLVVKCRHTWLLLLSFCRGALELAAQPRLAWPRASYNRTYPLPARAACALLARTSGLYVPGHVRSLELDRG